MNPIREPTITELLIPSELGVTLAASWRQVTDYVRTSVMEASV